MSQETKAQGTEAPGGGVPPPLHTPPPPVQRVRLLGIPPVHLQATPGQVHNPAWSQPTGSGLESNSAKPPFCHLKSRHVSYHIESLNKLSPKGPLCARRCYRLQGVRGRGREPGSRGPTHTHAAPSLGCQGAGGGGEHWVTSRAFQTEPLSHCFLFLSPELQI